jgi:ABC-type transporter Mla maintaining outer membrane lipid asymmetry ATPase subunit MlaF
MRLGMLFQQGALFSALTVKENIQVPMREYLDLPTSLMDELAHLKIGWWAWRRMRPTSIRPSSRAA